MDTSVLSENMTPQFKILTGQMAYWTEEGYLNSNIFYRASLEDVKKNFEEAKRIYPYLFRFGFIPSWCRRSATKRQKNILDKWKPGDKEEIFNEIVRQTLPPPSEWKELVI